MSQRYKQKQIFALKQDLTTLVASQIVDFGVKAFNKSSKITDWQFAKNLLKNFPFKKFTTLLKKRVVIIPLIFLLIVIPSYLFAKSKITASKAQIFGNSQTNFSPQTSVTLNRKFEIPIRNSTGAVTGSKLPITITTVDSSKKILIQGKPATARDGKVFLILNLDIDNATTNQLSIRPVDFIRLQDEQGKSFAPDVHNEVVKAEAISVKKTRVGFVVDQNQKNFKFLIGEIGVTPETVEITL